MIRLAEIYKQYWGKFLKHPAMYIEPRMFKAVNQTMACRTPALGTRVYQCPECEKKKVVHHSCKNRFCPRCGYRETRHWTERLFSLLAPVRHHHAVFTLPEGLMPIVHRHPKAVYDALFSSASWVLKEWFRAKHTMVPGIIAVLHTAGFALKRHIHLHVLVTGGGVSLTLQSFSGGARRGQWHELERNFLTRIDHFRKRFRWRFEHDLLQALRRGELQGISEHELKSLFTQLNHHRWVVAIQKGLHNPESIVRYIGRYIKRAPFAEQSIRTMDDGMIRFMSKQSRKKHGVKPAREFVSLPADDFLRRLLAHVPLEGFHTVRYYGAYHGSQQQALPQKPPHWRELQGIKTSADPLLCPSCKHELVYCGMEFPQRVELSTERVYAKTG